MEMELRLGHRLDQAAQGEPRSGPAGSAESGGSDDRIIGRCYPPAMPTVLVTGASGFVGSYLVPALLSAGHRVRALVRTDAAGRRVLGRLPEPARAGVEPRLGDVTDRSSLDAALAGSDAVIHLVAIPRDRGGGAELERVNVEGTRNLIAAAEAAGVRRYVHRGPWAWSTIHASTSPPPRRAGRRSCGRAGSTGRSSSLRSCGASGTASST